MDTYLSSMTDSNKEKLIRTIIVSNEKRIDVFRIHVFEKSLKFDPHFAYGISRNDDVYNMVADIEKKWRDRTIEIAETFHLMVGILETHENYLQQYYFRPEELNVLGRLSKVRSYSAYDEKNYTYFMCLKKRNSLKKISRKEFESNMKDEEIANSYIENYSDKGTMFFNYRVTDLRDNGKNCFLMFVDDNLKVGFVKK